MRSIVGRFLEHSRIYVFENGGEREVFIASADWMGRNLDRRVEIVIPVIDPSLPKRSTGKSSPCSSPTTSKPRTAGKRHLRAPHARRRAKCRSTRSACFLDPSAIHLA